MKKVKSLARVTSVTSPRSAFPGYSPIIDIGIVIVPITPSIIRIIFSHFKTISRSDDVILISCPFEEEGTTVGLWGSSYRLPLEHCSNCSLSPPRTRTNN